MLLQVPLLPGDIAAVVPAARSAVVTGDLSAQRTFFTLMCGQALLDTPNLLHRQPLTRRELGIGKALRWCRFDR